MTMYLPLGPDGTPPEGAVPDSPRYEPLTTHEVPEQLRLPLGATGAAAIALGAAMMYFGNPWGILSCVSGGAPLLAAVTGGGSSAVYRESQSGAFVEATPEHEEQAAYAVRVKEGMHAAWYRVVVGLFGLLMVVILVLGLADWPAGAGEWKAIGLASAFAAIGLYIAVSGRSPWRSHEPPLPPRFHEFADPARPLPPEVFARGALPAARATAEADVPPRPSPDPTSHSMPEYPKLEPDQPLPAGVEADAPVPRGVPLAAFTRPRPLGERLRSADWALGALLLVACAVSLAFYPDQLLPIIGGITALAGGGKLIARHFGAHDVDELPPASPAFHALADPTRPLAPGAPVSRPVPPVTPREPLPPAPEHS